MQPNKACPVVLRRAEDRIELLVFRHPLAGVQLVKGGIKPGETAAQACVRELAEESGLRDATVLRALGTWSTGHDGQVWAVYEMNVSSTVPDGWSHRAPDDGGHDFEFFWHPLDREFDGACHPLFIAALAFVREAVAPGLAVLARDRGRLVLAGREQPFDAVAAVRDDRDRTASRARRAADAGD